MKRSFVPFYIRQTDAILIAVKRMKKFFYEELPNVMNVFTSVMVDFANKLSEALQMEKAERKEE